MMRGANDKSSHILSTSATLFGLCYVVFTSLKSLKLDANTLIDEFTAISMVLFMISCTFSFLAIRRAKRSMFFENIADYVFLAGLFTLFSITIAIILKLLQ
jgi:predicted membrane channel-forming protein YqfA (hemolysin III family)